MRLTDLYTDLMPRLPGADETLVLSELFAAARIFCNDGISWVIEEGPLDIRADNPNIYLDPLPNDTRVGEILSVRYETSGTPRRYLNSLSKPPPETTSEATSPANYYMKEPGWLVLYPTLSIAIPDSLYVDCSVVPIRASSEFPETFSTHHREALIDGTCYRMMMMSSKPWTDRATALIHGKAFRNHISTTRTRVKSRYSRDTTLWQFPAFA